MNMAETMFELLTSEHKRVERIIKALDAKDYPKTCIHLIQASNSLRYAAISMKEYEDEFVDEKTSK